MIEAGKLVVVVAVQTEECERNGTNACEMSTMRATTTHSHFRQTDKEQKSQRTRSRVYGNRTQGSAYVCVCLNAFAFPFCGEKIVF